MSRVLWLSIASAVGTHAEANELIFSRRPSFRTCNVSACVRLYLSARYLQVGAKTVEHRLHALRTISQFWNQLLASNNFYYLGGHIEHMNSVRHHHDDAALLLPGYVTVCGWVYHLGI